MGLFNTTVHVTAVEKRAPTDESVRLLRDMEKAARDNVIAAMQLPLNDIKGVVHSQVDMMRGQDIAIARVNLNGKIIEASAALSMYDASAIRLAEALRDALAKEIANAVLTPAFNEMLSHADSPFHKRR